MVDLSRGPLVAALALTLVVLGGVGGALLVDHTLAQVGVGTTDGTAFDTVDDAPAATERLRHRVERDGGATTTETIAVRFSNGTVVRSRSLDAAPWDTRNWTLRAAVRVDGAGYRYSEYRPGSVPADADGTHAVVEGRAVYKRVPPGDVNDFGLADRSTLRTLSYVPNGSATRNGTRLRRYDVVGQRGAIPLLSGDSPTGYVLVTPETETVRYALVLASGADGRSVVEYAGRPTTNTTLPDWLEEARTIPPRSSDRDGS